MEQITEKAIEQTDKKRLLKESLLYFALFMTLDIIMYCLFVRNNPHYDCVGYFVAFITLIPVASAVLVENGFDFKKIAKSKFNLAYMIFLAATIVALILKDENVQILDTTYCIGGLLGLFVLISVLKDKKLLGNLSLKSFFMWVVLILLLKSLEMSLFNLYVQGYVHIYDNILASNIGAVFFSFGSITFNLFYVMGEEYGWRYFLQPRLQSGIGKVRGVLLTGLVWGIYHMPMYIIIGAEELTYSLALVFVFCICMGVFLGLCYMKTNSVILVSTLHFVNNEFVTCFFDAISNGKGDYWRYHLSAECYMVLIVIDFIVYMPFLLAKEYRLE